jgi:hypothetical protein
VRRLGAAAAAPAFQLAQSPYGPAVTGSGGQLESRPAAGHGHGHGDWPQWQDQATRFKLLSDKSCCYAMMCQFRTGSNFNLTVPVTREALDSYLTSQGARRGVPPVQGRGRGPAAAGA